MGQFLRSKVESGVAVLTISNPPVNALSSKVLMELKENLDTLTKDPAVKAIVLTGEGMVFVAGADIREILSIESADAGMAMVRKGQQLFDEIEASRVPVIAAINGACLGGGSELAMACHIRIASDKARFAQPEINLGIIPGLGGTQRLPRLVGTGKALEILLSGDMISAQEAKAIGYVQAVVPETALLKHATGLARKIASKGKCAIGAILEAVMDGTKKSTADGLSLEADLFGKICSTEDMKEGLAAFVEKRQPKFKDR